MSEWCLSSTRAVHQPNELRFTLQEPPQLRAFPLLKYKLKPHSTPCNCACLLRKLHFKTSSPKLYSQKWEKSNSWGQWRTWHTQPLARSLTLQPHNETFYELCVSSVYTNRGKNVIWCCGKSAKVITHTHTHNGKTTNQSELFTKRLFSDGLARNRDKLVTL